VVGRLEARRAGITCLAAAAPRYVLLSAPLVEADPLDSPEGTAIVLINWSGEPLADLTVTIPQAGKVKRVTSLRTGKLRTTTTPAGLQARLPLATVDVLMLDR
jgi:hypothetical protein